MKTYTTKIAKNGATLYYSVETGKRIAKEIALEIERKEIIANGTVKERYELAKETTELLKNKAGEKPVFKIFGNYTERAFSYAYGGWYHNKKHGWYFTNCNYWSAKSIKNHLAEMNLTVEEFIAEYNKENNIEETAEVEITEADVEDYAVSTEAQDAAIEAEIENAAQDAAIEAETISTDERIAEIENEIAPLVEEMKVVATDLQMFKEYPDEYTQEFIDERENLYDSLSRKYRKLVGELESLQKTPPENPKPETPNETHAEPEEITFIAQNGASLTIEGGMPTIAANGNRLEVNGIWLGDYYTNEDAQEAAEALKIDVEEFGDDHPVLSKEYFAEIEFEESPTGGDRTAEHLNANAPEGWTVTRADKKINVDYHGKRVAEVDRITERDLLVPHAFFQQFQPLVDKSKTPENFQADALNEQIDCYLNTAYDLEGMAEELEIICDNFNDDAQSEEDWHVASRISFYVDHVKRGIEGLREMIEWYIQRAEIEEDKLKEVGGYLDIKAE